MVNEKKISRKKEHYDKFDPSIEEGSYSVDNLKDFLREAKVKGYSKLKTKHEMYEALKEFNSTGTMTIANAKLSPGRVTKEEINEFHPSLGVDSYTLVQLRGFAKGKIKGYSSKTKSVLYEELCSGGSSASLKEEKEIPYDDIVNQITFNDNGDIKFYHEKHFSADVVTKIASAMNIKGRTKLKKDEKYSAIVKEISEYMGIEPSTYIPDEELEKLTLPELKKVAQERDISIKGIKTKPELISALGVAPSEKLLTRSKISSERAKENFKKSPEKKITLYEVRGIDSEKGELDIKRLREIATRLNIQWNEVTKREILISKIFRHILDKDKSIIEGNQDKYSVLEGKCIIDIAKNLGMDFDGEDLTAEEICAELKINFPTAHILAKARENRINIKNVLTFIKEGTFPSDMRKFGLCFSGWTENISEILTNESELKGFLTMFRNEVLRVL